MRDYLVYLSSPILRLLLGIGVQIPITTYYLSPNDFGVFFLVTGIAALVAALATPSPSWVLSANFATTSDRSGLVTTLVIATCGLHIVWTVPLLLLAPVLIRSLGGVIPTSAFEVYFLIAILGALANAPAVVLSSVLVLQRRALASTMIDTLSFAGNVAITAVLLACGGLKVTALFWGAVAQGFIGSCVSLIVTRQLIVLSKMSGSWLREILHVAGHGIPNALTISLATAMERLIIGHDMSLESLGYYTHSQRYRGVMQMGLASATSVIRADALETYAAKANQTSMLRTLALWATVLNIGGLMCALFATDIVGFLSHQKFRPAGPMVFAWWIVVAASSVGLPYFQYLLVNRHTRLLLISSVISTTVMVAGLFFLVPLTRYWGVFGSIIVSTIGLQFYRRHEAIKRGCPSVSESFLLWGAFCDCAIYVVALSFDLSFLSRLLLFALVAAILCASAYLRLFSGKRATNESV